MKGIDMDRFEAIAEALKAVLVAVAFQPIEAEAIRNAIEVLEKSNVPAPVEPAPETEQPPEQPTE